MMKISQSVKRIQEKKQSLLNIQKNEKLRTLLLNKFIVKYKSKDVPENVILHEIDRFMETKDLTINNLRELDREIMLAVNKPRGNYQLEPIKKEVVPEYGAQKALEKRPPRKMLKAAEKGKKTVAATQKHLAPPARDEFRKDKDLRTPEKKGDLEEIEKYEQQQPEERPLENEAEQGQPQPPPEVKASAPQDQQPKPSDEPDEEEEWDAFQKFKNKLYEEELRQEVEKKRDNVIFMREQLEKQLDEKEEIKKQKQRDDEAYAQSERELLEKMNEKERVRQNNLKEKALNEKKARIDQINKVKERKTNDLNQQREEDQKIVDRIKQEQIQEKEYMQYKKIVAQETLKQMMNDTLKNREKQKAEIAKEKQNDVRAQELYKQLLDRQDEERAYYFKNRDEANSKVVNKIAEEALEKQKNREKFETDMHKAIEKKKELKERRAEEMRRKLEVKNKLEMREFLAKQLEEKRLLKEEEKAENAEQRRIWLKQQKEAEEFNKKRAQEIYEMNKTNQKFLDTQKEEVRARQKKHPMSQTQYLMNKNLFEDAKKKLEKEYLEEGDKIAEEEEEQQ